jgi:hypothetical protein
MTRKDQLEDLVITDPKAAAQDPIWQLLHLEDKHFLRKQSGRLKLHLLGLLSEDDQELLQERLSGTAIPVDVFEIDSCNYDDSECFLSKEVQVEGFSVDIFCYDTSAVMVDCEQCNERLPLAEVVIAFHNDRNQDLRVFAKSCGIEYEPNLSPKDGYPMRPGGVSVEIDADSWEFEEDSFPDDSEIIKQLTKEANLYVLKEEGLVVSDGLRPLFSSAPSWDDDWGTGGSVNVSWNCDCYIPVTGPEDHQRHFKKVRISEDIAFKGNNTFDDCIVKYTFDKVTDLESALADELSKVKISDLIEDLLLRVLGLSAEKV